MVIAISFCVWGTAKADIAPPPPPTGSNPLTGADTVTQVQMAAENQRGGSAVSYQRLPSTSPANAIPRAAKLAAWAALAEAGPVRS